MELLKLLIFRVGDSSFALLSRDVKEIIDSFRNLNGVFYGGNALKGLLTFEGDVASVLNGPLLLNTGAGQDSMILVCKDRGSERMTGMTISEIEGMKVVSSSRVAPPEEGDSSFIVGYIGRDGEGEERVVAFLDLKKLLDYADTKIERL